MPTVARLKLAATDRGHGVQLGGVGTPDYGGVLKGQGHPYGGTTLAIARAKFRLHGVGLGASSGSADRFFQTARSRCHSRFLLIPRPSACDQSRPIRRYIYRCGGEIYFLSHYIPVPNGGSFCRSPARWSARCNCRHPEHLLRLRTSHPIMGPYPAN